MYNPHHLHIVLASDSNYAEFVAVVIVSLFDTNRWFEHATIHLLSNGIDKETLNRLKRHIPEERGSLEVYDISSLESDLGIEVPNTIAITSYARLFLPDLLDRSIDRVLYIDCDIVIANNIMDFYNVDFSVEDWVAGVFDTLPNNYAKSSIGLQSSDEYFNAGVLLFNLKSWRENDVTRKCLDFLFRHNGKVFHHDQGIINAVCHGHKLTVHPRYNVSTSYYSHPYSLLAQMNIPFYQEQEVSEAILMPAIIHFTEGFYNRPWMKNSKHPRRETYRHYHEMTEWAATPLRRDSRSMAARILSWSFLHLSLKNYQRVHRVVAYISKLKG